MSSWKAGGTALKTAQNHGNVRNKVSKKAKKALVVLKKYLPLSPR